MKAAVAADVIQTLSMTAMLIGIVIYCSIQGGGMTRIFEIGAESGRFNRAVTEFCSETITT